MEAARPGACPGRDRAPPRRVLERWSALGGPSCGMPHTTQLYQHVPETRWPIVYSSRYNITFMGLEKLHPFDAGKWGKVISFLKEEKLLSDGMLVEAREASEEDLLVVHTRRYLNELKWSFAVATITEIPPVIFLPNFLVQRKVLKPLRIQTGGTIMVVASITVPATGEGASAPTQTSRLPSRAMGTNGTSWVTSVCTSWMSTTATSTLETALPSFPVSAHGEIPVSRLEAIRRKVELEWGTEDDEYLDKVERNLKRALQEHPPDVMVYNAGTDILEGDRLGGLSISPQGIVKRDELVFRVARRCQVPILMVTSGGYQKRTARIIADSILNLYDLGLIGPESASISAQNSDTPLLL
ncbi:histone deacetylase 11 isoform X5 [Myotis myotis]|uniref:histone deacetylase 11 isoform X5 n=1 Tax=Myotis myotis TaxID=51298 RepID=UPI0017494677|nr:histone deacetylase 11 isoform X5 [Myotis myotis]